MEIKGNTVLITGGATGIGLALAENLLEKGNQVIICGRRQDKLVEAQQHHPELHINVCDVADDLSRNELLEWAKKNFGDLNLLINNAGIQCDIDFTKGTADLINGQSELKINLEAPIFLTALFIPFLATKNNPAIVNITSGLGFIPATGMPIYSLTKAAMHSYSLTLRQQLARVGIKVFEAIPPFILDSELNMEGRAKRFKRGIKIQAPSSAEFAAAVIKGLQENEYEIGYGTSEEWRKASRADQDRIFEARNS
jgi:uncharacterized oxidoreductase